MDKCKSTNVLIDYNDGETQTNVDPWLLQGIDGMCFDESVLADDQLTRANCPRSVLDRPSVCRADRPIWESQISKTVKVFWMSSVGSYLHRNNTSVHAHRFNIVTDKNTRSIYQAKSIRLNNSLILIFLFNNPMIAAKICSELINISARLQQSDRNF